MFQQKIIGRTLKPVILLVGTNKGEISLEKTEFDLNELIAEVAEEAALAAHSSPIVLQLAEPVKVYTDRHKIGSVISNFISNAYKYWPNGESIVVKCDAKQLCKVSVTDKGIGIAESDKERIFERYYRIKYNYPAYLRLSDRIISECRMVQRHDGKIGVESEYWHGSTFYFTLPS